jgi:hypothetical protein
MTAEDFRRWLDAMKAAGKADNDGQCGALLGLTKNTIATMKAKGADLRTALACAALIANIPPYGA